MLQENHKIKEPEAVHESLQRRADILHTHVHMHVCVCIICPYSSICIFNRVHSKLTSELTNSDQKVHQISVSIDYLTDATLHLAIKGY